VHNVRHSTAATNSSPLVLIHLSPRCFTEIAKPDFPSTLTTYSNHNINFTKYITRWCTIYWPSETNKVCTVRLYHGFLSISQDHVLRGFNGIQEAPDIYNGDGVEKTKVCNICHRKCLLLTKLKLALNP